MNQIKHKDCGGEIVYMIKSKAAQCNECKAEISSVAELLLNVSIVEEDNSEVVSSSTVKENQ